MNALQEIVHLACFGTVVAGTGSFADQKEQIGMYSQFDLWEGILSVVAERCY